MNASFDDFMKKYNVNEFKLREGKEDTFSVIKRIITDIINDAEKSRDIIQLLDNETFEPGNETNDFFKKVLHNLHINKANAILLIKNLFSDVYRIPEIENFFIDFFKQIKTYVQSGIRVDDYQNFYEKFLSLRDLSRGLRDFCQLATISLIDIRNKNIKIDLGTIMIKHNNQDIIIYSNCTVQNDTALSFTEAFPNLGKLLEIQI